MKNRSQPPQGGFPEHNERAAHHTPYTGHAGIERPPSHFAEEQLLLDYLLETGFAWEEAEKLLDLRDHLYDNAEMHQRMADDYRLHFARWLYEQQEINEDQTCETEGQARETEGRVRETEGRARETEGEAGDHGGAWRPQGSPLQ